MDDICVFMLYTGTCDETGEKLHIGVEPLKPLSPGAVEKGIFVIDVVVETVSLGLAVSVAVQVIDVT